MAADVLIVYASRRGSTEQVARGIGEVLRGHGLTTRVEAASDVRELEGFGAVVLGGSIYFGRWHRDARIFLRRHRAALASRPLAVFALGPAKATAEDFASSRHQLDRALAKAVGIEPRVVAVFGGAIDPEKLRFPFNHMPKADIRDWQQIRAWAHDLPARLDLVGAPKKEAVPV